MSSTLVIADLHLSPERPDITQCFFDFLNQEKNRHQSLYILGDLFEAWVGDDDLNTFTLSVAEAIEAFSRTTPVFFIHGNRDFLLGKKFAKRCGMILLPEVEVIDLYGKKTVIMHGDTLCTRDVGYQKFRKKSRSWWWQGIMKSLPLFVRRNIAENYRKKSAMATAEKSQEIMDVTPQEVVNCLEQYHSQLLIHGHTHRPAVHELTANKQPALRVVLGDWYEQGAWLKVTREGFKLLNQPFTIKE